MLKFLQDKVKKLFIILKCQILLLILHYNLCYNFNNYEVYS